MKYSTICGALLLILGYTIGYLLDPSRKLSPDEVQITYRFKIPVTE